MRHKEGFKTGYLLSVISFALATLCKEPALTLPVFLIAYDTLYKEKEDRLPDTLKRYIPYIIVSGCYLFLRSYALGGFAPQEPHIKLTGYEYFINIFPLFSQYLWKLLLPINLNAFYVLHPISSIFQLKGVLALCITAAFVVMSVVALRKNKTIFLSLLLIAVPLLPVLYIPALGENVFTERYLYLPSFGFVLLLAVVFSWVKENPSKFSFMILKIITVFLVGLYSFGTISRNAVWKNDLILFSDTKKKSPDSPLVHNNLGNIYAHNGRIDEAIEEYQAAIKLYPAFAKAHYNLGVTYGIQGRIDEAIKEFKTMLKINPDYFKAHYNLGVAYDSQNRIDEAIEEYQTAIKLNPYYVNAHYNLGVAYKSQNRIDEATKEFQIALRLNPDYVNTHNNPGLNYAPQDLNNEAITEFKTALQIKPDEAESHNNLGLAYAKQGRIDEAIKEFKTALQIKPDEAEGHNNLGLVYAAQGRIDEAIKEFKTALQIKPDEVEGHNNLGLAYRAQGRVDEAIKEFKAALKLNPEDVTASQNLEFLLKK
jgi:tetratricopeptide (TPR) repeat protein